MGKAKKDLGVDRNGVQKMMRTRDYLADMSGQIGMNLVANVVGQLTYFYTDKVGLAAMGIGIWKRRIGGRDGEAVCRSD